ncbi:hypothetical protein CWRG_00920 [Chthonomonas calidirosea]|nr:hypothetical protein CWRG_00920 [Chthonomonas calidirosea]
MWQKEWASEVIDESDHPQSKVELFIAVHPWQVYTTLFQSVKSRTLLCMFLGIVVAIRHVTACGRSRFWISYTEFKG